MAEDHQDMGQGDGTKHLWLPHLQKKIKIPKMLSKNSLGVGEGGAGEEKVSHLHCSVTTRITKRQGQKCTEPREEEQSSKELSLGSFSPIFSASTSSHARRGVEKRTERPR